MARWAALLEQRRQEKPVLLVDAGDFCPVIRKRHQDVTNRYFFEGLKHLGYDAIAVGEQEIRFGRKRLLEVMKSADLPLVSSNIIDKRGNGPLVAPYVVTTVGGRRVLFWRSGGVTIGIMSVVLPVYVHSINESVTKYYDIKNTRMTALQTASTLREQGCDIVIALSHLGWQNTLELAASVPGIDIVINGHRARTGSHHEFAGETIVVDTGPNRSSFTEIEVTMQGGVPRFAVKELGRVLLSLKGHPFFLELEKAYEAELETLRTGSGGGSE
jgi:5'-nucleotidase